MGALFYIPPIPSVNLPRSYLGDFLIWSSFATEPTWSGRQITWQSIPGYTYTIAFHSRAYNWSSNVYSLDYLMDEAASSIDCHFFTCFDNAHLGFTDLINEGIPEFWIQTEATHTDTRKLSLPPAPPGYWLPRNW